ncbi:ABC transporter permease [Terriglobus saanensis]|uniref:Permease n=1 Tax=Terriglobus saanensis (strain ATCC BAA-1853 / DSM 23119 / SP1PR4) TaxID=401053 RepID=E8V8L0_TERSS|nr:ABC transporter permease [Terriglobus saanensis]ADV82989.1 permease [Terriglobus saanensis SP1PR4]
MALLSRFFKKIRTLIGRERFHRELEEEMAFHRELAEEEMVGRGVPPSQARYAAKRSFGNETRLREQSHEVMGFRLESVLRDVRFGLRALAKSPGFTAVAVISLALGIGANTAIFSLIDQLLLQRLPVRDPQQLVSFGNAENGGVAGGIDLGQFGLFPWYFARQLEVNPGPFQGIASFRSFTDKVSVQRPSSANGHLDENSSALLVPTNLVSGNYFNVIGARPLLGRTITSADAATSGSGAVVVLSYHFWEDSLSGDTDVIGKSLRVNGTPLTVIGVMPKSFQGIKLELEPTAFWIPVTMQPVVLREPSLLTLQSGLYFLHVFGRLSAQAARDKGALAQSQLWLDQQIHAAVRTSEGTKLTTEREQEINHESVPLLTAMHGVSSVRSEYGQSLQILMAVVGLVLLIACANLANFLLARGAARQREIATRLALGSSRGRIVRQSLIETLLLSFAGGALGIGLAFAITRSLIAFVGRGETTLVLSPVPDAPVLFFTFAVSIVTALLFGLAPALASARGGTSSALNSNTRTAQGSEGRSARLWPRVLVTVQVMLSLVLLVGAGLFLRTLRNLQHQDYGFERDHLLVADFNAKLAGYQPSQTSALHQRLLERVSALPGVRSAALAATPPISRSEWSSSITISGYSPAPKENMGSVLNRVSGRYFETAGIAVVAGRGITSEDSATSMKVAVVNEALAKRFFPKGDAIGRSLGIDMGSEKGPWQIVGVVRDTRSRHPRTVDAIRMTYIPLEQIEPTIPADPGARADTPPEPNQNRFANTLLVRTTGDPAKTIADLRAAVSAVDPNLPLLRVTTMEGQISGLITHDELISTLTGVFSLLALLLAAIGLYGVMSYNVVRRTNEIGIRLALGAQTPVVRWMILREALLLLALGVCLGMPLAFAASSFVRQQLFGVGPVDRATFAVAIAVVGGMTLFAAWLPARRASKVDPMVALRFE